MKTNAGEQRLVGVPHGRVLQDEDRQSSSDGTPSLTGAHEKQSRHLRKTRTVSDMIIALAKIGHTVLCVAAANTAVDLDATTVYRALGDER